MKPTLQSRIRGSVLAQAWGDALGAPFEFAPPDAVKKRTGEQWLERLHPFAGKKGPHGMWADQAPAGTGTDDARYNYLFIELAVELGEGVSRGCLGEESPRYRGVPPSVLATRSIGLN